MMESYIEDVIVRGLREEITNNWYAGKVPIGLNSTPSPTMAAVFANTTDSLLLVGNEAGQVSFVDVSPPEEHYVTTITNGAPGDEPVVRDEVSYGEAIFDLALSPQDEEYAVALGNNQALICDAFRKAVKGRIEYHDASIRCLKYRPNQGANVIATGGRDGKIALWDLRQSFSTPVAALPDAHGHTPSDGIGENPFVATPSKRVKGATSVTSFLFSPLQDHLLASVGQPDYAIRTWDLRYIWRRGSTPKPSFTIAAPQITGRRRRAFVSLAIDSIGCNLYAVSSDNHIYSYSMQNYSSDPCHIYGSSAFRTSGSFFTRCSLSPDDRYLLCGATESGAFIWPTHQQFNSWSRLQVSEAIKLDEHRFEVSCVAWSRQTGNYIYVGGEDYVSRIWRRHEGILCKVRDDPRHTFPSRVGQLIDTGAFPLPEKDERGKVAELESIPSWPSRTDLCNATGVGQIIWTRAEKASNKLQSETPHPIRRPFSPVDSNAWTPLKSTLSSPVISSRPSHSRSLATGKENVRQLSLDLFLTPTK